MTTRPTLLKSKVTRLAADAVLTGEGSATATPRPTTHKKSDQPVVTVRRSGDVIEALEVTCPCGRSTVIECLYDAKKTELNP